MEPLEYSLNQRVMWSELESQCPLCNLTPRVVRGCDNFDAPLLECRSCRFQWIGALLTPELADEIYNVANYHSVWGVEEKGSLEPSFVVRTKQSLANRIVAVAGDVQGLSVLEVGCAAEILLEKFKNAGANIYGVELAVNAAQRAKERVGEQFVWTGTIESCPNLAQFDLIVAIDLIEHVAQPLETLREFRKRLKPDGKIILVLPDLLSLTSRILSHRWPEYKREHRYYFTKNSMQLTAVQVGLSVMQWRRFTKWMTLPYFFHILGFHSKNKSFKKIMRLITILVTPLGTVPIPMPSGNSLAILKAHPESKNFA